MTNRSRILFVLIAVLLAGCLMGIAGHQIYIRSLQEPLAGSTASRVKSNPERLAKRLQLAAEQEVQLKAILEASRRQIDAGRTELESKVEAIRSATNGKIFAILDEQQKNIFQQLLNESKSSKHSVGHAQDSGNHGEKH